MQECYNVGMKKCFRSENGHLLACTPYDTSIWINLVDPTREEIEQTAGQYHIDPPDLSAALDEEESSRVVLEDDYVLILVDIPVVENKKNFPEYFTIPLGLIITPQAVITICTQETPILQAFEENKIKDCTCSKQLKFVYQILYQTCALYQSDLRNIDKLRASIEAKLYQESSIDNLLLLHQLETSLVYFATSLHSNEGVLDRLNRYSRLKRYPDDQDLLEDVMIENRQSIEMTTIYRDILNGTRELINNISDTRLNNVMKYLTSITLVMAIPTIVSGFYGMNVSEKWIPLANTAHGFLIICLLTGALCLVVLYILWRKKML